MFCHRVEVPRFSGIPKEESAAVQLGEELESVQQSLRTLLEEEEPLKCILAMANSTLVLLELYLLCIQIKKGMSMADFAAAQHTDGRFMLRNVRDQCLLLMLYNITVHVPVKLCRQTGARSQQSSQRARALVLRALLQQMVNGRSS